jgi:hypothetical protein
MQEKTRKRMSVPDEAAVRTALLFESSEEFAGLVGESPSPVASAGAAARSVASASAASIAESGVVTQAVKSAAAVAAVCSDSKSSIADARIE